MLAKNRKKRLEIKEDVNLIKRLLGCSVCGERDPIVLDFHHPDPEKKDMAVAFAVQHKRWSLRRILEEIARCICLCSNCHRKLNAGRFSLLPDAYLAIPPPTKTRRVHKP